MIYLDNAATSYPKPPMVVRAMAGTLSRLGGNPGRSGHKLSLCGGRVMEHCREILAEELGCLLHIPVRKDVLYRIRNTRPQKSLNDTERIRNLKGAFAVAGKEKVKAKVLIIDDIYTTGSTIRRCAKMLRLAGVLC